MIRTSIAIAICLATASASAQSVRYRRPFNGVRSISAYFDHGGGGGCTDWACGGVCYDTHSGTDYPMPVGTDVIAGANGRVAATFNGCDNYGYRGNPCGGRCGNYVIIDHPDGSRSTYCHMRNGSHRVSVGDSVACGQVIGESASSGSSTGPHLHFGHRSPGAGSSSDPYAGGCSRATSLWVSQGSYRGVPADSCVDSCAPSGESCNGRDDDCDARVDEGLVRSCGSDVGECTAGTETCSGGSYGACVGSIGPTPERCDALDNDCDAASDDERICEREEMAWSAALTASTSETDASGDGRADACAYVSGSFVCLVGEEEGFTRTLSGATLDESDFWNASAIRMGDLDADGRADVCGREGDRLRCWLSNGVRFEETIVGPVISAATNVELADVSGDGRVDACVRSATGLACHVGNGRSFDRLITLAQLSDESGFADIIHHGSLRFGDLDGDGRADVCARHANGVECWKSTGDSFGERIRGPLWSDADGFAQLSYWSTMRMADVNADGRDDLCARTPGGFRCALANEVGFGNEVLGPKMDAEHYGRREVFATIRLADVDGDSRADVCAREPDGLRCWLFGERGFDTLVAGPALTDETGWGAVDRFRSIRMADVNGDGRADLCARHESGLHCSMSTGQGFDRTWLAAAWADRIGVDGTTIRIAGGEARSSEPIVVTGCSIARGRAGPAWLLLGLVFAFLRRRS